MQRRTASSCFASTWTRSRRGLRGLPESAWPIAHGRERGGLAHDDVVLDLLQPVELPPRVDDGRFRAFALKWPVRKSLQADVAVLHVRLDGGRALRLTQHLGDLASEIRIRVTQR